MRFRCGPCRICSYDFGANLWYLYSVFFKSTRASKFVSGVMHLIWIPHWFLHQLRMWVGWVVRDGFACFLHGDFGLVLYEPFEWIPCTEPRHWIHPRIQVRIQSRLNPRICSMIQLRIQPRIQSRLQPRIYPMIQRRIFAVRSIPIASSISPRPAPFRSLPIPVRSGLLRFP